MRLLTVWPRALLALVAVCASVTGCGGGTAHNKPSPNTATPGTAPTHPSPTAATPFRFFSPQSFWNQPVSSGASVDPGSAAMVGRLSAEVQQEQHARIGPWIDASHDGIPIITVPASQPTVAVTLTPTGNTEPAMRSAWSSVPLPPDAAPSTGDRDLAIWQPSTNKMWEFFGMTKSAGHWLARWGGAMRNVSTNPGVYGPGAWPGAQSNWGVTASSLPLVGGAITVQQLRTGEINHALALAIPQPRARVFATPAERTDGSSPTPSALPEGARLRLDPSLNLSSLGLPKPTLAIAEAAQRYGIVVRDTSGIVAFAAQDPAPTTASMRSPSPYTGPHGLFDGQLPSVLLARFPWGHLQVLKLDLKTNP